MEICLRVAEYSLNEKRGAVKSIFFVEQEFETKKEFDEKLEEFLYSLIDSKNTYEFKVQIDNVFIVLAERRRNNCLMYTLNTLELVRTLIDAQ